ncbi:hypothetical protein CFC21_075570 [Triticum aestivum]|uniref:Dirigent protein n=2 Tax=Triticum aestivum TaxID=4565 RepID=A0A9R1DIZ6_WHEAT|nr:hypothetical protein CFC21_009706 [Triticum aestivum]KAF6992746.1 hypothetical protein CFC21_009709 [Triticum aestivum]KAF7070008.1 hypothetical protein CFC21_075570 [Triticum aestivum]
MATPLPQTYLTQCCLPCEKELNLVLYLHQVVGPNANQKTIIPTKPGESLFGITAVNNWAIVNAPDFKAKVVGHAQGIHVMADQPSVGYYNSSTLRLWREVLILKALLYFKGATLQVMGIFNPVGEWAIIGGTGELTMARGTIKYKILQESAGIESIRELNIRAFYTPPSALVVKGA